NRERLIEGAHALENRAADEAAIGDRNPGYHITRAKPLHRRATDFDFAAAGVDVADADTAANGIRGGIAAECIGDRLQCPRQQPIVRIEKTDYLAAGPLDPFVDGVIEALVRLGNNLQVRIALQP